jgi:hypothetical protein
VGRSRNLRAQRLTLLCVARLTLAATSFLIGYRHQFTGLKLEGVQIEFAELLPILRTRRCDQSLPYGGSIFPPGPDALVMMFGNEFELRHPQRPDDVGDWVRETA